MKKSLSFILFLFLISLVSGANAADVTLQWNPVDQSTGYKIYWGQASRSYGDPVDVGTVTTYTLKDLNAGSYFFAVTAYNAFGESGYSAEVSCKILPPEQQLPPVAPTKYEAGAITVIYHMPDGRTIIIVEP